MEHSYSPYVHVCTQCCSKRLCVSGRFFFLDSSVALPKNTLFSSRAPSPYRETMKPLAYNATPWIIPLSTRSFFLLSCLTFVSVKLKSIPFQNSSQSSAERWSWYCSLLSKPKIEVPVNQHSFAINPHLKLYPSVHNEFGKVTILVLVL